MGDILFTKNVAGRATSFLWRSPLWSVLLNSFPRVRFLGEVSKTKTGKVFTESGDDCENDSGLESLEPRVYVRQHHKVCEIARSAFR